MYSLSLDWKRKYEPWASGVARGAGGGGRGWPALGVTILGWDHLG